MKYTILGWFQKVIAFILSIFSGFGMAGGEVVRPDANTVTEYNAESADYKLDIAVDEVVHDISDILFGVFLEDISFAADGGLYAEKVVNRSFEYFEQAKDGKLYGYSPVGEAEYAVEESAQNGLNENNTNYLVMSNPSDSKAGIANRGFLDGMSCAEGESYNFSVYVKGLDGYTGKVYAELMAGDTVAGSGVIEAVTDKWQQYKLSITSSVTANENVTLRVTMDKGKAAFDMISLFPANTYKNRENGLRRDLAEKVAAIEPGFLRFPGGCVIEGNDPDSAYSWKHSIGVGKDGKPLLFNGKYGDVAAREYDLNIWTNVEAIDDPHPSFMSYGLGFFEYFQFAEDMGAVGVPVLNCGLHCQARGKEPIPMDSPEFAALVQDMLDLVEFCRGDVNSTWGKVRASLGHPEPFELKYICIGNENEGELFYERYEAFLKVFLQEKAKNPKLYEGLELVYSAGFSEGTHRKEYLDAYKYAKDWLDKNPQYKVNDFAGAVDHHYYNDPSWFLDNTDYYDESNYKRDTENMTDSIYGGAIGAFIGEYAARSNRLEAALAEAAYMTGLERNGDIVKMAAYAPLFGNLTVAHWAPDLIWFNNHLSTASINYYVQKLFSNNAGTKLLKAELSEDALIKPEELRGMVGVGTWYTKAEFDNLLVTDNATGKTLDKEDFGFCVFGWSWTKPTGDKWKVGDGKLYNKDGWMEDTLHGAVTLHGDADWTNYTYSVDATKVDGAEGFLIPVAAIDYDNYVFWNIGGWGNTKSCLQIVENGEKSGEVAGTLTDFTVETGKTYNIKLVVDGISIKGYIDDELQFDYKVKSETRAEAYQVVSTDETGDTIIKLVNVTDGKRTFAISLTGAENINATAKVQQLAGDSLDNDNILGEEEACNITEFTLDGISGQFNYTVPQYSVTVIRISH